MKKICGRFLPAKLDQPLLGLIGPAASPELQYVARTFIQLQDARHSADYDLGYTLTPVAAGQFYNQAAQAISSWEFIQDTARSQHLRSSPLLSVEELGIRKDAKSPTWKYLEDRTVVIKESAHYRFRS